MTDIDNKLRDRIISELTSLLDDEQSQLKKVNNLCVAAYIIIVVLLGAVLLTYHTPGLHWAGLLAGVTAGVLAGITAMMRYTMKQWPVLKTFLDEDKIRNSEKEESS